MRRTSIIGLLLLLLSLASCKEGSFYAALGDQVAKIPLRIAPAAATIVDLTSMTFSATGGASPYAYSVVSGPGSIIRSTGVFTANGGGTVVIRVTDKNKKTSDATLTVTSTGTTHADYTVSSVASTGPYLAGNAIDANFTLENVGNADGNQPVSWSAYVSTNNTLGPGDTLVASSTTSKLNSLESSVVPIVPVTGNWPNTVGATYYLIVSVAAADETGPATNVKASPSPGFPTSAPNIDYAVTSVSYGGGPTAQVLGDVIDASFHFENTSTYNGSQIVSWTAYASTSGVVDSSAIAIASGVSQPLAASTTSGAIPIVGKWPAHFGNYDLVVKVSVTGDSDTDPTNDSENHGITTAVGYETEPNNNTSGATDLGITLLPGMSVTVSGSLSATDTDDFFAYNTGTAASITVYITWAGNHNVTIYFMTSASTFGQSANVAPGTSISDTWLRDAVDTRWIRVSSADVLSYSLTITGN